MSAATIGMTYEEAFGRDTFRQVMEAALSVKEWRPVRRMALRRGLRDDNKFEALYAALAPKAIAGVIAQNKVLGVVGFDFQSILDWFLENWDEILKIIFTIIPFLI